MNRKRQLVTALVVLAVGVLLVWGFRARRGELASEAASDAPVISPRRLRPVSGPVGDEVGIILDPGVQMRLGIGTRALGTGTATAGMKLAGQLIADPSRITTIQAPIAGRLVAPSGHWPVYGERIAGGVVLAQVSDARPLVTPRGGTVTKVGAQPGEIVQAGQLLVELTDVSQLLARVVWRQDAPSVPPATVSIAPVSAGVGAPAAVQATLLGPAADVDSVTRALVYLYRTSGTWIGARPGIPIVATLLDRGAMLRGFVVPTDAVVQWEGLAWAYVRHGSGTFVRTRVDTRYPVAGGFLIDPAGLEGPVSQLRGADTIVVRGAQILLSEEFRAHETSGDAK